MNKYNRMGIMKIKDFQDTKNPKKGFLRVLGSEDGCCSDCGAFCEESELSDGVCSTCNWNAQLIDDFE